jgi:hypothetical protein
VGGFRVGRGSAGVDGVADGMGGGRGGSGSGVGDGEVAELKETPGGKLGFVGAGGAGRSLALGVKAFD